MSEVESAEAELIGCGRDSIEFFVTRVAVRPSRIEAGWPGSYPLSFVAA